MALILNCQLFLILVHAFLAAFVYHTASIAQHDVLALDPPRDRQARA